MRSLFSILLLLPPALAGTPASLVIDYPEQGTLFPPGFAPPAFLWRDSSAATRWRISITFAGGGQPLVASSAGPRLRIGPIDPETVAPTNELPKLTPQQAAQRTWKPDPGMWQAMLQRSAFGPATVVVSGYTPAGLASRGSVEISTAKEPVGAPIFYRDVPLMPSELEKGVIKPLAATAMPLVAWRLRYVQEARGKVVMENLPVCANCHSFSSDGKVLGMDLDGLQGNRGMYILKQLSPDTEVGDGDVVQWATAAGKLAGNVRVGFMSQVSPDGSTVVTTINPAADSGDQAARLKPPSNYFVANFTDYRFLQVFFPTRGFLYWYNRRNGVLRPLPGADDPRYVQMGAVWSPDGRYLVFARAEARDADTPGAPMPRYANDPQEPQIRYDLYRIPFDGGRGGRAEPLAGASANGMSNTFPKISPDGRWIVFVRSRNGMLMRPDSQLYIVPASGGEARRLRANLSPMNSWHSFSPNGRWLVFSSKARSPYTQLYLTHIDEQGNDSPAILIENTTAANRAANLPEFVNLPPDGLAGIDGPALEYFRLVNRAVYAQKQGLHEDAAARWRRVLELRPDDEGAHRGLGSALLMAGRRDEAASHIRRAEELKLRAAIENGAAGAAEHSELGRLLLDSGRLDEAAAELDKALALQPDFAPSLTSLGRLLARQGKLDQALDRLRAAAASVRLYAPASYQLGLVLEMKGDASGAEQAWRTALSVDPGLADAHLSLARALEARGLSAEALAHWRAVVAARPNDSEALRRAAWLLATSPEASLRNGEEAVALAARSVSLSSGRDAASLDALAAAYAESHRFADAVATARQALSLAEPAGGPLPADIRNRIKLYQSSTPFRDR